MESDIIKKYNLKVKSLKGKNSEMKIFQAETLDNIIDSIIFNKFTEDERFPYFLNIWDSGIHLFRFLTEEFDAKIFKNKKIVELGSGTGIVGISFLKLGGKVLFTDFESEALELCKLNANLNHFKKIKTLMADWRNFPDLKFKADYITGSDLFYEKRMLQPLTDTSMKFLDRGAKFILADPSREYCSDYLRLMDDKGYKTSIMKVYKNSISTLRDTRIYQIER